MTVTLKISICSGASDADKSDYMDQLVEDIKSMRFDSWRQTINTDWDTRHRVNLKIEEVLPRK